MPTVNPPKNRWPRWTFQKLVKDESRAENERRVLEVVFRNFPRPMSFSEFRAATGIGTRQLDETLDALIDKGILESRWKWYALVPHCGLAFREAGRSALLNWLDLLPRSSLTDTPGRIPHVLSGTEIPRGSRGRLPALWLLDVLRDEPNLTREEVLNRFRQERRVAVGKILSEFLREGVLHRRSVRTGKRGRPRIVIELTGSRPNRRG